MSIEVSVVVFLLFFLALALGFWQGTRYRQRTPSSDAFLSNQYNLKGLNFLLNNKPDPAIDAFVHSLDVNAETLETHLSLGALLRKQGEVERAIKVHQNLLARSNLTVHQQHQVEYELAQDYFKAGLYDRAEHLLLTLKDRKSHYTEASLLSLIDIYQYESEWQKALDAIQFLEKCSTKKEAKQWAALKAHCCCEIAEDSLSSNELDVAKDYIKKALSHNKQSLRASLLACRFDVHQGHLRKALNHLKRLLQEQPAYIDHALPTIFDTYQRLNDPLSYRYFLESFYAQFASFTVMKAIADELERTEGIESAIEYVSNQVASRASLKGVNLLLDYYLVFSKGRTLEHLRSLKTVLTSILNQSKSYRCQSCGLKTHELHWHCPTCKTWDSIQPADDLT